MLIGLLSMSGANDIYDARQKVFDRAVYDYAELNEERVGNDASLISVEMQVTVSSEIVVDDGRTSFYGDDLRIGNNVLKGKALVIFNSVIKPDFGVGDSVRLVGRVDTFEHKCFDTYYAWSSSKKIYCNVYADDVVKLADAKPRFPLNIQTSIKQMFYENCDEETAEICQALILGDKRGIGAVYDDIKNSGMAHVLAVSGLHITTLATALYWLLKKMKVNPKIAFSAVTALTFFYLIICSFTASAVRAFIMTFVFNFASAFGLKKDNLSALSFAGIVLLLVNPVYIMDIGYLLSIFAVLGLFLFGKPIFAVFMKPVEKFSPKKHRGMKMAQAGAASISANIFTVPMVGYFFGTLPTLFIFSSVLVLPYLMVVYIVLLAVTVFSQITTLWGLSSIMNYLLLPFRAFVKFVGGLSFASIEVSVGVGGIICWVVAALLLSKHIFLSKRTRAVCLLVWAAVSLSVLALAAFA